jgi:RNA polymerase sigma-70 factor, ECF subfamily
MKDSSESALHDGELVGALVARAIRRDRDAFAALYELYFERIYRYARLKIGDPAEAEDVTAAVFLNAWRAVDRFTPQGENAFLAWLFRLTRNVLIDRYRRQHNVGPLDGVDESALPLEAHFNPEAMLEWQVTVDELQDALQALTEEQREVVLLRFVEGLSAREVGAIMGKQEGTVRGLQFRAIEALRRVLSQQKVRRSHE